MPPSIRQLLQDDLPAALKAKDRPRIAVLRTTLAALGNAEAVDAADGVTPTGLLGDVERRVLTEDDVRRIVARERDELLADADGLRALGRSEADDLAAQASILDGYLSA